MKINLSEVVSYIILHNLSTLHYQYNIYVDLWFLFFLFF